MPRPSLLSLLRALTGVFLMSWASLSHAQAPVSRGEIILYQISPSDKIRISIFQEEDLSVISRVDAKGMVNLPLVGETKLANLTVSQAEKTVATSYKDGRYLRNPQVTINVEEYAPREVSIQGYVRTPGRYPLPVESTMTLLDLVTRAGGFMDTAKGTSVTVTRIHIDGTKKIYVVDVESLIKGKDKGKVIDNTLSLQPGDIVYVPERLI